LRGGRCQRGVQRGALPTCVHHQIVDSRYVDNNFGLWRVYMVFGKSRPKQPEFMAAIALNIIFMVMAAPVGDTFSTATTKI
jgi:hypothetical protein